MRRLRRGELTSMALAWVFVLQLLLEGAVPLLSRAQGLPFNIICTLEGARALETTRTGSGAPLPVHDCPVCVAGCCCCMPGTGPLPTLP
jgi:hypothetical protein